MLGLNGAMLIHQTHQTIPSWAGVEDKNFMLFLTCFCFIILLFVAEWEHVTKSVRKV